MATMTFKEQVAAERSRQISLGYTAEHDDKHGPEHLRRLGVEYEEKGEFIKSAALYQAYVEAAARHEKGKTNG